MKYSRREAAEMRSASRLPTRMKPLLIVVIVLSGVVWGSSQISDSSRLSQLTTELQKKPNDRGLRESIIKLASQMKPSPAIPREAKDLEAAALSIVGGAKTEADYAKAAEKFEEALLIAPWSETYYHNAALMYEKAKQPEKASVNYQFYILAAPNATDVEAVTRKIEALKVAATRERQHKLWNGPWTLHGEAQDEPSTVVAKDMGDRIEFYHKRNFEQGEKVPFLVGSYRRQNGAFVWGSWTFTVHRGCGSYPLEVKAAPDLKRFEFTLRGCRWDTKTWTTERFRMTLSNNQ